MSGDELCIVWLGWDPVKRVAGQGSVWWTYRQTHMTESITFATLLAGGN